MSNRRGTLPGFDFPFKGDKLYEQLIMMGAQPGMDGEFMMSQDDARGVHTQQMNTREQWFNS